jgi:Trypsin-co-occurring domain 1
MGRLMELPLQDGGAILVQVDKAAADPVARELGERRLVTEQAVQTLEQAIARVQPASQALISRLRALGDAPDAVELEFGLGSVPRRAWLSPRPAAPPTSR